MLGVRRADVVHRPAGKFRSRLHDAVIRVYDAAGTVIEMHEHKGDSVDRAFPWRVHAAKQARFVLASIRAFIHDPI